MIVGLLSDTHGKADITHRAVKLLIDRGAEYLIHCGDVGGNDVLDALAGHPATFVFGNNDYDRTELQQYANIIDIQCGNDTAAITIGNKHAVITHGDDNRLMHRLITEQKIDYLFHGHTHETRDERIGKVRIINPGALYRAAVKTVALLDTVTDKLEFIVVN